MVTISPYKIIRIIRGYKLQADNSDNYIPNIVLIYQYVNNIRGSRNESEDMAFTDFHGLLDLPQPTIIG